MGRTKRDPAGAAQPNQSCSENRITVPISINSGNGGLRLGWLSSQISNFPRSPHAEKGAAVRVSGAPACSRFQHFNRLADTSASAGGRRTSDGRRLAGSGASPRRRRASPLGSQPAENNAQWGRSGLASSSIVQLRVTLRRSDSTACACTYLSCLRGPL